MRLGVLFVALLFTGCASVDLKSVKESPAVHEVQARGNHAELAGCVADNLQGHAKYVVRSQKYAVRNYTAKSEVQAYQESIYGGNVYLFLIELEQKDSQTVQVSLRRLDAFKEFIEEALQSCSERA